MVVRRIFSDYVNGVPLALLAERLNEEGYRTRTGQLWTWRALQFVLASEVYVGQGYAMKRQRTLRVNDDGRDLARAVGNPRSDWVTIPHPPIIDQALWDRAQELRASNARLRAHKGYQIHFPLRGLTWCGHCGCRFHPVTHGAGKKRMKDGTVRRYESQRPHRRGYACYRGRHGNNGCPRPYISASKLETAVWAKLAEALQHPEQLEVMTAELRAEYEQTGTLQEVQRLQDAIEDCERERQRAVTAFQKGYVQEDELDVRMRSINERREMYQMELEGV